MILIREARKRGRQIVVPIFAAVISGYFAFHAVLGDRGIFAYADLSEEVREAQLKLAEVQGRREALQSDVGRLQRESLDLNLLEERVRAVLNYVDDDDLLIQEKTQR
ncbi:MAG: FtsB family cell division protein [Alphaproteobacteria bacterium]